MIDASSQDWAILRPWLNREIEEARTRLETPGHPQPASDVDRGRIAAFRDLIKAVEAKPLPLTEVTNYG